jgi:hypothetical protein
MRGEIRGTVSSIRVGTPHEIEATVRYLREHASSGGAKIDGLLRLLRDDLRRELRLTLSPDPPVIFRFTRHWDSGDQHGNTIARTVPVQAQRLSE